MVVLGLETSCDETGVALYDTQRGLLSEALYSQVALHAEYGGVVPELGQIDKRFIDCGGVLRKETVINFQLYTADDFDHRLSVQKLKSIIELSEKALGLEDLEIEVEYQSDTIGKYALEFKNSRLTLVSTQTACLAKDQCGIPERPAIQKPTVQNECAPGSGCC